MSESKKNPQVTKVCIEDMGEYFVIDHPRALQDQLTQ